MAIDSDVVGHFYTIRLLFTAGYFRSWSATASRPTPSEQRNIVAGPGPASKIAKLKESL
ncbi:hypothetical protein LBW59_25410 [Ralstonia solanacearum]|uniref:Uncharacterized protein n=1 Tax=Ralstonia solanacearum TaxID=305 RepID=A0AAW5ZV68_RALSL|nr:hypothetical protein [Ralstonia solanacearum]MDB0574066.1 hypothetical protein [Ralstonia solanacearum]